MNRNYVTGDINVKLVLNNEQPNLD